MTETAAPPVRPRRNRRVFVLLGVLVLLVAYVGFDFWTSRRVDAEVARFEERYGPLKEWYPKPVPAADNRARVVKAAAELIAFSDGKYPSDFNVAFAQYSKLPKPVAVPADLRAFVEANRAAIRLADSTRTRGRSDFEIDYPSGSYEPRWMDIRTLSFAIYLSALMDLEAGHADDAAKTITTGLAVSASMGPEPGLIAQLIRIGVAMPQFEATQRLVIDGEPSKAALADLAHWLAEARVPDSMLTGLSGEIRHFNAALSRLENGRADGVTGGAGNTAFWFGSLGRLGRPWVRLARVRYLERMDHLLGIQAGPRPRPAWETSPPPPAWAFADRLAAMSLPGLERAIETGDEFYCELSTTEIAVALRRFKLERGTYPDDLSELAPTYLARLSIDPYTGRPPVYAREGAGFTLRAQGNPNTSRPREAVLGWSVPR
jgi:hypothetical protein